MRLLMPLVLLSTVACKGSVGLDVETPEDVAALCASVEPEIRTVRVDVPANDEPCAWGENGNIEPAQGLITARDEVYAQLELPDDIVVCDLTFEFQVDPEVEPEMVYDDHMFFLFNDVVLASSAGDKIAELPVSQDLPIWDWESIVGQGFDFNGVPWCLGQDEGRSDCTIPRPDTRQPLLLRYDDDLINELSLRARRLDRYEFGFVVFGDNDPQSDGAGNGDCTHDAFSFDVDVPFVSN
jgi:hypothetical protein